MASKEDLRTELEMNWAKKSIKVHASRDDEPKIAAVQLNYSDEIWSDILDSDGECLPSCCATIRAIRDILMNAKRESGWIDVSELETLARYADQHGSFYDETHPIHEAVALWEKIKDEACQGRFLRSATPDDPKNALATLMEMATAVTWDDLYDRDHDSSDTASMRLAGRLQHLMAIKGAVSTLFRKLSELDEGPLYGHACVYKNKVMTHSLGLWVLSDPSRAEKFAKDLNKRNDLDEPVVVRKVRVTLDRGVEFVSDADFVQPDIKSAKDLVQ